MIAGDDDHKLENNPGRVKAIEAAVAVNGVAIFPQLSAEQREQGMTDFNDLGRAQPEVVSRQLVATVNATREGRTIIRPRRRSSPPDKCSSENLAMDERTKSTCRQEPTPMGCL